MCVSSQSAVEAAGGECSSQDWAAVCWTGRLEGEHANHNHVSWTNSTKLCELITHTKTTLALCYADYDNLVLMKFRGAKSTVQISVELFDGNQDVTQSSHTADWSWINASSLSKSKMCSDLPVALHQSVRGRSLTACGAESSQRTQVRTNGQETKVPHLLCDRFLVWKRWTSILDVQ